MIAANVACPADAGLLAKAVGKLVRAARRVQAAGGATGTVLTDDAALPPRAARHEQLRAEVKRLFTAHEGTYGSPRITADLREAGWAVSKNTVAAVMAEQGLATRRKKKRTPGTRDELA